MCQGHLRYSMNQMKIDYNKTFKDQHPPVITNIVREANPTLFCSNSVKIQKEYPPLDIIEWGQCIKALIGDIIRNRRRNMFRKEKERRDPDLWTTCKAAFTTEMSQSTLWSRNARNNGWLTMAESVKVGRNTKLHISNSPSP